MSDGRVRVDRDDEHGIVTFTLSNPERKNAYDPAMRLALKAGLDEVAYDDDTKVVILRGDGGVFSTGADMNNAYAWYGSGTERPSGNGTRSTGSSKTRHWPRKPGPGRAAANGSDGAAAR